MAYSSKDFGSVSPELAVHLPTKLIHRSVEDTGIADRFSKERGHGVAIVDLPTHTLSMTVGHLAAGERTRKHRHNYETVIFVLEGEGESAIEGKIIPWRAGDALYVPSWAWHSHRNTSPEHRARYIACENAPLLQNLGNIALREEESL